jgi:hypothetical protein
MTTTATTFTTGTPVRVLVPREYGGGAYTGIVTAHGTLQAAGGPEWLTVRTPYGYKLAISEWTTPRVLIGGLRRPRRLNSRAFYAADPERRASARPMHTWGYTFHATLRMAESRSRYCKRLTRQHYNRVNDILMDKAEARAYAP